MWVLTREHNEYDQYGAYYVMCWDHKPSEHELLWIMAHEEMGGWSLKHLMKGGGRTKQLEDIWYNLEEETR